MDKDNKRIGLALSGGGYRAAAYHIGTLRALHKLGILENVDVISSVSGGSITAAYYALNKEKGYEEFERDFIASLKHNVLWLAVIEILSAFGIAILFAYITPCGFEWLTIIVEILVLLMLGYYILPVSRLIEYAYNLQFFKKAKLSALPPIPILAINATDLSTGNQFTFSQDRMVCYPYKKCLQFNTDNFPLAKAVMASSCVPFAFSPIKIGKKYQTGQCDKSPLLVDGGLYDNQGAHKFEGHDRDFFVDYAIVSDAGNTKISSKWCVNLFLTLKTTSDILMRRIKNFQRQHNSYIPDYKKKVLYAYNDLMWNEYESFPGRFVQNIKDGYITKQVLDAHGISNEMLSQLRDAQTYEDAFKEILSLVEKNIGWQQLLQRVPKNHTVAVKVCTNLVGLTDKKINALIEHSEWMTEVQVRMHLPFLLKNN